MIIATIFILVMILIFGVLLLRADARQKRIKRQVAVAAAPIRGDEPSQKFAELVRLPGLGKNHFLYRLLKYEPSALYNWPARYLVLIGSSISLLAIIGASMVMPIWVAVLVGIVAGGMAVRTLLGQQRYSYADRLLRQLPDTLQLVTSAVRAGLPVTEAFRSLEREMPNPTGEQFALVSHELALGRSPEETLSGVYERTHVEEYAIFSVTLAVQSRSGGGLAETLQILADTVRDRVGLAGRAKALAGDAKLSAIVIASIPFIAGGILYFLQPQNFDPLFHDPRGHMLIIGGATSMLLGIYTMRRMISKGDHSMTLMAISVAAMILLVATAAFLLLQEARVRQTHARVDRAIGKQVGKAPILQGFLQSVGEMLRRFYTTSSLEKIRSTVEISGFNPHRMIPILLASKTILMLLTMCIGAVVAYFLDGTFVRLAAFGGGMILGIMGPEWILAYIRHQHTVALERGTPDALDLLVVCSEAGMGLESGLERVSYEMMRSNPATANVLSSFLNDLRILSRQDAFANLKARAGAEGMQRFGTMLGQSLQYGTPLSDALRAVASELRRDRMNKLEEKANKLGAKLIFPLIFLIMPSFYIVLLGSSFMRLYDTLSNLTVH